MTIDTIGANTYTAPKVRADQVTIEEYRKNTPKYTFPITEGPKPEVGSVKIYKVPVENPSGEIQVEVFFPTEDAAQKGGLKTSAGLPVHVDYHGDLPGWVWSGLAWLRVSFFFFFFREELRTCFK